MWPWSSLKNLTVWCPEEDASGGVGRKDGTWGQLGGGWWPEDGPNLREFTWELGLAFPIQKPLFFWSGPESELPAPTNLQEAETQIKPLVYLLESITTVGL